MILPVRYYRISEQAVAMESAFVEHLKLLKTKIFPIFDSLVIGMIEMGADEYARKKPGMVSVIESEAGFTVKTICTVAEKSARGKKLLNLWAISSRLKSLIKTCDVLHTGLASDVWFPMEFIATLWGGVFGKKMVYVVDIDFRESARMNYKTGNWSLKSYLLCKYVYDQLRAFQIRVAVQKCTLILLKGRQLWVDFGQGKPHVKNFLNASHSQHHIIGEAALQQKITRLVDRDQPLEMVYFGRLVDYKGIDYCIRAVAIAHQRLGSNIRFNIIGSGEEAENLKQLAKDLGVSDRVVFHGAFPFNLDFFTRLYTYHLLLAAPLSQDTPRSALDAMAAGIPILAFDTYYYQDFIPTGAVDTVPWLSVEQLAQKMADYDANRNLLAEKAIRAMDFAQQNTQEDWLDRRFDWTLTYAGLQHLLPDAEPISRPAMAEPKVVDRIQKISQVKKG
jgi:glycosyltransferase involved in cell wall biosynthesis